MVASTRIKKKGTRKRKGIQKFEIGAIEKFLNLKAEIIENYESVTPGVRRKVDDVEDGTEIERCRLDQPSSKARRKVMMNESLHKRMGSK